jgi:hypothetical protein
MYRFEKPAERVGVRSVRTPGHVLTDRSVEIADNKLGRLTPGGGTKFGQIDPLVQSADCESTNP